MKPLIVLACIALAGCAAPIKWYRADASQQQFIQDQAYCRFEAEKATASYGPGPRAFSLADAIGQGIGQGLEIASRQHSIFKLCMEARGYVAVPAHAQPPATGYVERPQPDGVIVHSRLEPGPLDRQPAAATIPAAYDSRERMNRKVEPEIPPAPAVGKFTYEVEQFAKAERCSTTPKVTLTATGPGFENYSVPCADGDALAVRCEMGNCRALK